MPKVLLVVDTGIVDIGDESIPQLSFTAAAANQVQVALTKITDPVVALPKVESPISVKVIPVTSLTDQTVFNLSRTQPSKDTDRAHAILYPLTLNLPKALQFPGQAVYQACREISKLRQRVQQLGYAIGAGYVWLPIVLTAKGPLYAEVIGLMNRDTQQLIQEVPQVSQLQYCQPLHLADQWRQLAYELAYRLLRSLSAPPATYLMQFGFQAQSIYFDRLWPFPAKPAIASIGVQQPDLFACHWYCLAGLPILDLTIPGSAFYQVYG